MGDKRATVQVNIYWPEIVHALRQCLELSGPGPPSDVTDAELVKLQTLIGNARVRLREQTEKS
jgi:hypothetical protein